MKLTFSSIVLAASLSLVACQSEISDKPAAEVSDTAVTTATESAATDTASAGPVVTANVIKEKSSIGFVGAKVTGDHTGKFNNFDGTLEYAGGRPQKVSFTIDLNSVQTDQEKLDGHLKSPDFFDVAKYPQATFTSTSLTEAPAGTANGATHMLEGTLEMHGVKKNVSIPVKTEQTAEGVRTTSEFTINRHDWGISYKGAPDNLIKDNVLIKLDLSFPPPPAA
jgi:polyisoprenoid-binding protein YceI